MASTRVSPEATHPHLPTQTKKSNQAPSNPTNTPLPKGTQDVIPISYTLPDGRRVTLIDTPGFDDSDRSDADILGLVAAYMAQTYKQGVLLNGILFLQPINQPRLQGSEVRRTRLFKKLLGEDAYRRVIIATTMWSKVNEAEAESRQRQRAARHDIWGDMVARGATVERHDDTAASAARIVNKLVQFATPVTLQFQRELEATGGRVALTSAGKQLDADLGVVITKLRGELEELRRESTHAASEAASEIRQLNQKIARYEQEKRELKDTGVSDVPFSFFPSSSPRPQPQPLSYPPFFAQLIHPPISHSWKVPRLSNQSLFGDEYSGRNWGPSLSRPLGKRCQSPSWRPALSYSIAPFSPPLQNRKRNRFVDSRGCPKTDLSRV